MDKNKNLLTIEQFAAYLDENIKEEQARMVSSMVEHVPFLKDALSKSHVVDDYMLHNSSTPDYIPEDVELPDVDSIDTDIIEESTDETLYDSNNQDFDDMEKLTVIGQSSLDGVKDRVFIAQPDDHSCALRAQQICLRDFGIDIPFEDLEQMALENEVYSEDGTSRYDVGKVMELAGVPVHQVEPSTLNDLMYELSQGHRVIVGLDADELWYNDTIGEKMWNHFKDLFPQGGNHALVVAGLELDITNLSNSKVVLTDTGTGDVRIPYPLSQFVDAWNDANNFMVATNDPAPYQYDPESGLEVPSNFVKEFAAPNDWVLAHSYQLAPDLINIPKDFIADWVDTPSLEEFSNACGVELYGNSNEISQAVSEGYHATFESESNDVFLSSTGGDASEIGTTEGLSTFDEGNEDNEDEDDSDDNNDDEF